SFAARFSTWAVRASEGGMSRKVTWTGTAIAGSFRVFVRTTSPERFNNHAAEPDRGRGRGRGGARSLRTPRLGGRDGEGRHDEQARARGGGAAQRGPDGSVREGSPWQGAPSGGAQQQRAPRNSARLERATGRARAERA